MLGFSTTSPDLVICGGSPSPDNYISSNGYSDSPELIFLNNRNKYSTELSLSLDNGIINGSHSDLKETHVSFSTVCQTLSFCNELSPESSFELLPHPGNQEKLPKHFLSGISINAGCTDGAVFLGGEKFLEDNCFTGGETVLTNATIGYGQEEGFSLYQTARFGNFSYCFQALEPGHYVVGLHLAEIVFTDGPPGIRTFDVFVQEKKVRIHEAETNRILSSIPC